MGAVTTLLTFEEFERLPDEPGKCELLDGELIQLPPAKLRHMGIAERLFLLLRDHLQATNTRGAAHMEFGYKLGPRTWVQPDISIAHPDQPHGDYLEGAPLLAIEVISESNTADHIHRKLRKYFEHGAAEVWVVYPTTRSVVVHHAGESHEHSTTLATNLLPGLSIDLAALFE
jgi:Uma2 family endonuclease